MLYTILKPVVVFFARTLFRIEGRGQQHVPATGPVLLVSNHLSTLDPPLVGCILDRHLSFLAKAELFRIPVFGPMIRRLNARPVRREGADAGALRAALRVLQEGGALLVFPEGTRGEEGVLREAKAGAGMLAVLSGAPVVPVYVSGSGRAWPRGRRLPRPAKVRVTFGPVLKFERGEGSAKKEKYEAASREMMAAIARLRDAEVGGAGMNEAQRSLQIH
jgi:1-acyl-sn-glycerol-3-phosphate acyltransferase